MVKKKKKNPHSNLKNDTKERIYKVERFIENKFMVTKGQGEEG